MRRGGKDPSGARRDPPPLSPSPSPPPTLNFCSPLFDPALALATPGVHPPIKDAKRMDNLSKFRFLLPADHPDSLLHVEKRVQSQASRLKAAHFKRRHDRLYTSIFGDIEPKKPLLLKLVESVDPLHPLGLLRRCVEQKLQVRRKKKKSAILLY